MFYLHSEDFDTKETLPGNRSANSFLPISKEFGSKTKYSKRSLILEVCKKVHWYTYKLSNILLNSHVLHFYVKMVYSIVFFCKYIKQAFFYFNFFYFRNTDYIPVSIKDFLESKGERFDH